VRWRSARTTDTFRVVDDGLIQLPPEVQEYLGFQVGDAVAFVLDPVRSLLSGSGTVFPSSD
jgi:hypothetical protein